MKFTFETESAVVAFQIAQMLAGASVLGAHDNPNSAAAVRAAGGNPVGPTGAPAAHVQMAAPVTAANPALAPVPLAAPVGGDEAGAKAAMQAYMARGQGRTAATAKAILVANGVQKLSGANPALFPQLIAAFNAS